MRLDDFLSTVGVVKRRTVAKELAGKGMVEVNGRRAKPAYAIHLNDIITLKGNRSVTFEVLEIPAGSVPKPDREKYFKILSQG